MQKDIRNWLVRTRAGEVLGPYTQHELMGELRKKVFSPSDEIAPSGGSWISAQALLNRDYSDEFTQTSTRNTAVTQSTASAPSPVAAPLPQGAPGLPQPAEELTPTPEYATPIDSEPPIRRVPTAKLSQPVKSGLIPLVVGLIVISGLWMLVSYLKPAPPKAQRTDTKPELKIQTAVESPFVRNVYELIQSGQTATALKLLTQYHEKQAGKDEYEYLIPYSALLITEGESPARARKLLEKVLASPVDKELKAQAHHWLGYLMLSQDENDMGENHFLESLQLNPKDPAARFNLGRTYLRQEKYRQALDYFQLAELEMPDLWVVHIYKGRAKAALGLMNEAGAAFRKAMLLAKDRWLTYIYEALFLMKLGKDTEAQALMRMMLTRDPHYEVNSPPPLGFFHEKVNYAEYLNAFIHIMKGSPGEEREMGKLYISYLLNGPTSEEAKRIEAVAEKGGLMAKVLSLKVILDRESTPKELQDAMRRLPKHLSDFGYYAYVLRGEAYMRLGNLDLAQADFQRALTLEPQSAISHWAYATLLQKTSRTQMAKKQIENLLSYHPNYIPAIVFSQRF